MKDDGSENVKKILERYRNASRDSLIPILQNIQKEESCLTSEAIVEVARFLKLPASRIYAVATFYRQFTFRHPGRCHIVVCRGTACHVKGSSGLLETFEDELHIKDGETTSDGVFSLGSIGCMGACGQAPSVSVNGRIQTGLQPGGIKAFVEDLRKHYGVKVKS